MLAAVERAAGDAGDALARARLVPAKAQVAVPDLIAKKASEFKELAPGSLLKFNKTGTIACYGAFPPGRAHPITRTLGYPQNEEPPVAYVNGAGC